MSFYVGVAPVMLNTIFNLHKHKRIVYRWSRRHLSDIFAEILGQSTAQIDGSTVSALLRTKQM